MKFWLPMESVAPAPSGDLLISSTTRVELGGLTLEDCERIAADGIERWRAWLETARRYIASSALGTL